MSKITLWIIIIGFLLIVLFVMYKKNFKRLITSAVCLVTGAPKTGKTLCCACLSAKDFKSRHRLWWFKTRILLKKGIEEPLFYTNTAFSFGNLRKILKGKRKPHKLDRCVVKIDLGHLERNIRFNYGSVIFIDEASLMTDNQDIREQVRNAELSLFNKLIAHETRGGKLYYDTQNIQDLHYACKRVCSNFFFIQKSLNFFLFRVLYIREMISEDLGQNNFVDDVDNTTRKVLIFRWWYKKYDRYYWSYLTDKLTVQNTNQRWYKDTVDSFNPLYRILALKYKSKRKNKAIRESIIKDENYSKRGYLR